jgi:hypothetical protein
LKIELNTSTLMIFFLEVNTTISHNNFLDIFVIDFTIHGTVKYRRFCQKQKIQSFSYFQEMKRSKLQFFPVKQHLYLIISNLANINGHRSNKVKTGWIYPHL